VKSNWARFTLMDAIILIAAFALGTCFVTNDAPWMGRSNRPRDQVVWAVSCVVVSGAIAAPLVLSSQCFRGRRAALSSGEWFWLVPLALYLTMECWRSLGGSPLTFELLWLPVQGAFSCVALFGLLRGLFWTRQVTVCRWTDHLGCAVCVSVGLAFLLAVIDRLTRT
jgi:hypothetical protein